MRPSLTTNISAADASVDGAGKTIDAAFVLAASALAVSTGSSTGTVKFQGSNDPPGGLLKDSTGMPIPVNWVDIPSITVAVTAASKVMIPKFDSCYRWIRPFYVKNNGSAGTITVYVNTIGQS